MRFNIQMFTDLAFNRGKHNTMTGSWDADIAQFSKDESSSENAQKIFNAVAGSSRFDKETEKAIELLNNTYSEGKKFLDSVKKWSGSATNLVENLTGESGWDAVSKSSDDATLAKIGSNFNQGDVGIRDFEDAQTYINSMSSTFTSMKSALSSSTEAINGANGAMPEEVQASLSDTVSNSLDNLISNIDTCIKFLTDETGNFAKALQKAVDDLSASAKGSNN